VIRLVVGAILAFVVFPAAPAGADAPGPSQGQVDALAAKVSSQGVVIHKLTEQLDQARLRVTSSASRLASVSHQHDTTVEMLGANRSILLEQALRAYMHGGAAPETPSPTATSDLTLSREYLKVASGDLANTADGLRLVEVNLRGDLAMLQSAQNASLQATAQLQTLRTNALATAANQQQQLDVIQAQLTVKTQAAAAAAAGTTQPARPGPTTQGLPVNNGLLAVVQQAAGVPVPTPATPVKSVTVPTTAPPPPPVSSGGGGHAGGVWLQLRRCESSDNYAENTGNGFYGAYQFSPSTWTGLGYPGRPDLESPAMQDQAAVKLQAQSGWGQWPACAAALGLI
jgi:hypothetical protein